MTRGLPVLVLLMLVPGGPSLAASASHSLAIPSLPVQPAVPPYAFDGAYANYSLTYFTQGGSYVYDSNFTVRDVDRASQTLLVLSTYNSYLAPFDAADNATFQLPIPFPAASPSQLLEFQQGHPSGVYSGDEVVPDIKVSVPAGNFTTYEVIAPVSTVWFDVATGVEVQERGLMLGEGPGGTVGIELRVTNVKATDGTGSLVVYLSLASVGWIAAGFVFALSWSYRREIVPRQGATRSAPRSPRG